MEQSRAQGAHRAGVKGLGGSGQAQGHTSTTRTQQPLLCPEEMCPLMDIGKVQRAEPVPHGRKARTGWDEETEQDVWDGLGSRSGTAMRYLHSSSKYYLASLCLSFLVCNIGLIIISTS